MLNLTIHTDGGSRGNPGPAACGVTITGDDGKTYYAQGKYLGVTTNNEAEYEAFLDSVLWLSEFVKANEVASLTWTLDSKLVVEQLNRKWKIKEPRLQLKAQNCWKLLSTIGVSYSIKHVLRHLNADADALVNQALDAQAGK